VIDGPLASISSWPLGWASCGLALFPDGAGTVLLQMTREAAEPIVSNIKEDVLCHLRHSYADRDEGVGSHVPTLVPVMVDSYAGGLSEGVGTPLCILEKRRASN